MTETTEAPAVAAEVKTPSPTNENAAPAEVAVTTNGHAEDQPAAAEQKSTEETNGTADDKAKSEPKEDVPPPKEMRAVVLTGFGGFKNVKILKKPEPSPQAGEVLIRVKAW